MPHRPAGWPVLRPTVRPADGAKTLLHTWPSVQSCSARRGGYGIGTRQCGYVCNRTSGQHGWRHSRGRWRRYGAKRASATVPHMSWIGPSVRVQKIIPDLQKSGIIVARRGRPRDFGELSRAAGVPQILAQPGAAVPHISRGPMGQIGGLSQGHCGTVRAADAAKYARALVAQSATPSRPILIDFSRERLMLNHLRSEF